MKHLYVLGFLITGALPGLAQNTGTLRGQVTLEATGSPLHHATITVGRLARRVETKDDGTYEITGLPPGAYTVTAHMHALSDASQTAQIAAGGTATADFTLRLAAVKEAITVTASGSEQTTFDSFQTVTSLESLDLTSKSETSLGEVLNNQPGIAKRSFGPGSSRPVIRGFDGDRVLVMQDGVPTGALSSQSGDHGESIDPSSLDRLEVVKGPATLLYGSNALGGVVNAVTGHHQIHEHPHPGLRGYLTALGGSANGHGGGSAGFEYGVGNWLLWGGGGGQRTGDYQTPIGTIDNSGTRIANTSVGFGRYDERRFADFGYGYEEGRYGVPFAGQIEGSGERISLATRRHNLRVNGGLSKLGKPVDSFRLSLNYSDWRHREIEGEETGTVFDNKQISYRGVFQQAPLGRLSGSFGLSGLHRDYKATGVETLAPPVNQNGMAGFALEELTLERFRLQFGGRVENNRYDPAVGRGRSFTGFSGAAGIHIPLWKGGALVANYTHSYRAPALEELYNHGPHAGNLTFEIGDPGLQRERSNGLDLALRHQSKRLRGEVNYFLYRIGDFVYLAPTGRFAQGLIEARYAQADSRFTGTEMGLDIGLHQNLWLNLGLDYVNAQLRAGGIPLPRIPPLRGRAGLEFRRAGFSLKPELVIANAQTRLFSTETRTASYLLANLGASYTLAQKHFLHVFSANLFNAGDRLYRNHLSFIKNLAPEIGRGVRFTYTVRFF
ncbi:MAG: TonB-dependent receptor [Acidobacteria bacterium]|nr:TonB-dependent receptor [Acidobacteriota bacterium]